LCCRLDVDVVVSDRDRGHDGETWGQIEHLPPDAVRDLADDGVDAARRSLELVGRHGTFRLGDHELVTR
jgi:hypothetical protein